MKKISFGLLLLLFVSCFKQDTYNISLPASTTAGNNIIGFQYGGNIWESISKKPGFLNSLEIDTLIQCTIYRDTINSAMNLRLYGRMLVENYNNKTNNSTINIGITNISLSNNQYLFDTLFGKSRAVFSDYLANKFYTNYQNSFNLTLTRFDTANKIISGTFSGALYTKKANPADSNYSVYNLDDSISIANGRFDVRYININE